MSKEVSILLIGIKGYGQLLLEEFLEGKMPAKIEGIVDSRPHLSPYYEQLKSSNIPMFKTQEDFFKSHSADLTIISTPIHVHTKQTVLALEHGSNVLCEKPMCTTEEEAEKIIDARNKSGKFVAIGFNWSFSTPIQEIKRDIQNGVFGKPKRLKSLILWPRDHNYFNRSPWAGEVFSFEGNYILDSVANNATAHFLHNMLFILGAEVEESAQIHSLTAELYRSNNIKTFDTCATHLKTSEGVDLYFYASHAVKEEKGPLFDFEFENARLSYSAKEDEKGIYALFSDGSEKRYGDPEKEHMKKVEVAVKAAAEKDLNILCGPEASLAQMRSIHAMHASVPKIPFLKAETTGSPKHTYVLGLEKVLYDCYEKSVLPSSIKIPWAQIGKEIKLPVHTSQWKAAVSGEEQ